MSSGMPYIGCKIRLISKAQNRYEGVLYTIDKVNSTVVLAKVKCFGTEGRPTNIPTPPKDEVYEYITFRGSDITDIALCDHSLPVDPAIIQSSGVASSCVDSRYGSFSPLRMTPYNQLAALLNQQYAAAAFGLGMQVRRGPMVEKAVQTAPAVQVDRTWQRRGMTMQEELRDRRLQYPRREMVPPLRPRMETMPLRSARGPTRAGSVGVSHREPPREQSDENRPPTARQGARRRRSHKGQLMAPNASSATLKFDTDFDFDSSNAKFNKEELNLLEKIDMDTKDDNADLMEDPRNEADAEFDILGPKCYYDKAKSFYDKISSDNKIRLTWAEERKRNLETFGVPGRFVRSQIFRGGYSGRRGSGASRITQRTRNGLL